MTQAETEKEKARKRREARLAEALRSNLRRRKAARQAPALSHCGPGQPDLIPEPANENAKSGDK